MLMENLGGQTKSIMVFSEMAYRPYSYSCGWTGISVVDARALGKALLLEMLPSPARFYARCTETARIQVGPSCLNS